MSINTARFEADSKALIKSIESVLNKVQDPKKRREILTDASQPVVDKAQTLIKDGKPRGGVLKGAASATYNTAKLIKGIRAPRGSGTIKSRFMPGNLRRSVRVLPLKKTAKAVIGPRVRKRTAKRVGTSQRNANAFYAQMIYGSARAFQKRIMIAALQSQQSAALRIIERETRKVIETEKRKQGL